MLHCDAETLALIALGEPLADDERRHLAECARCQSELDQNRAVVASGRRVEAADQPQDPPDAVWAAISGELGLDPDLSPFVPDDADRAERAGVIALAERRRQRQSTQRRVTWIAAAASVAGIAVGALGVAALSGPSGADPGTLIAESPLTVVPIDAGGSSRSTQDMAGTARIVQSEGEDYAEVDARGLPPVEGYYEVWLIKSDLSGMVSLGALTAGSQGRFTIPTGTDLSIYTIVDVSVENLDGDPTHSKESMLRGVLET
jgi:anti-sigma-K factor RskA